MGQAKIRGTFEERQKQGVAKRLEQEKVYEEMQRLRKESIGEKNLLVSSYLMGLFHHGLIR